MRKQKKSQKLKEKRTHPFDGAPSLLLPLVAAQLQGAVNVGFSVIGAQDEQSTGTWHKTYENYRNCEIHTIRHLKA